MGTQTFDAGYCVSVSSNVAGAMCESVTMLDQIQQTYTGRDVLFSCEGSNTNDHTFISMDCGNGQYITGFGATLE